LAFELIKEWAPLLQAFSGRSRQNSIKDILDLENVALRNIQQRRELEGPSPREKFERQQSFEEAKYLTSQYKDILMNKDLSDAMRDVYAGMFENHMAGLPEQYRRLLIPLTRGTPVDPVEQKKKIFDTNFSPPPLHSYDPEDPMRYAKEAFAWSDFQNKRERFLGLEPGNPPSSHALPENVYAIRDKNGKIDLMSAEDEQLQEIAKGLDTTAAALLARGGEWESGSWTTVNVGNVSYRVRPTHNYLDGTDSYQVLTNKEGKILYGAQESKVSKSIDDKPMPESLSKILLKIGVNNKDDNTDSGRIASGFREIVDEEGPKGIQQYIDNTLRPAYPGWEFRFIAKGKERYLPILGMANYHVKGDNWSLIAIPATRFGALVDIKGESKVVAIDDNTGLCYDYGGRRLGLYQELMTKFSSGETTWQD